jgi:hypothetical protein
MTSQILLEEIPRRSQQNSTDTETTSKSDLDGRNYLYDKTIYLLLCCQFFSLVKLSYQWYLLMCLWMKIDGCQLFQTKSIIFIYYCFVKSMFGYSKDAMIPVCQSNSSLILESVQTCFFFAHALQQRCSQTSETISSKLQFVMRMFETL